MGTTMTEIHESYLRWMTLALLLFALKNLFHALSFLSEASAATLGRAAQIAGILSSIVLFATLVFALIRQTRLLASLKGPADLQRRGRLREDGFCFHAMKIAALIAITCTGMSLIVLEEISADSSLPASFFLALSLFVLGGSYSIAFFAIVCWPERRFAGNESA